MSFLLFIALAGYLLASRVNQSAVIGEILVGLIVGPSVLGLITYTDFVGSLAHLGAVILLFVVGLEFRIEDILKPKHLFIATSGMRSCPGSWAISPRASSACPSPRPFSSV